MKIRLPLLLIFSFNVCMLSAQGTYFTRPRGPRTVQEVRKQMLGKALADFNFEDIQGNRLEKKELAGKIIVINLWFTTCQPCISEMPLLNNLVAAYKDTNVVFIAPALNGKDEIQRFLKDHRFNYQVVADQEAFSRRLNIGSFPTHIIADKNGIIRQVEVGYNPHIKEILGQRIDALR